jgi:glycosyltransferase involved in cell wall biosynthesis
MNIGSELIYNGINLDKIKVRKSVGRNKIFKMVQIGRLVSEKKGQELSIKALDKIVHEYNICNLKLDFIGWGKDLERLKQMVSEHSLNDYVSFLGLKSREYIYSQLCEYDLMIHPSLYEGFGLNVAESMAAKVPVLVSDIDGPMEIIDQGRYGYHFKAGSISDFSKGIVNVINHFGTNCQKKMIEDASCYVQNNFDVKITSQSYVDAYGTIENS